MRHGMTVVRLESFTCLLRLFVLGSALLLAAHGHAADAGTLTQSWVSSTASGNDGNACDRAAPCRTFIGAIGKTIGGGQINVLDPGDYGLVIVNKSITIDGGGTFASIALSNADFAITVAASANDLVNLRNLSIAGRGIGLGGINVISGNTLNIENVTLSGFTSHGLDVGLSNAGSINLENVSINDCDGSGVRIATSASAIGVTINRSRIQSCNFGVTAGNGAVVSIRDSDFSLNSVGLLTTSPNTQANVDNSRFASNGSGITASAGVVRTMRSTFFSNGTGINPAGGSICSTGDNRFAGNGSNGTPSANSGACTVTTQ